MFHRWLSEHRTRVCDGCCGRSLSPDRLLQTPATWGRPAVQVQREGLHLLLLREDSPGQRSQHPLRPQKLGAERSRLAEDRRKDRGVPGSQSRLRPLGEVHRRRAATPEGPGVEVHPTPDLDRPSVYEHWREPGDRSAAPRRAEWNRPPRRRTPLAIRGRGVGSPGRQGRTHEAGLLDEVRRLGVRFRVRPGARVDRGQPQGQLPVREGHLRLLRRLPGQGVAAVCRPGSRSRCQDDYQVAAQPAVG